MRHMLSITTLSFLLAAQGCGTQTVGDVDGSKGKTGTGNTGQPAEKSDAREPVIDEGRTAAERPSNKKDSRPGHDEPPKFAGSKAAQERTDNGLKMKLC